MELVQQLDDHGKPAWITLMILGFIFFWPIGLAVLAYMIWSGRMGCNSNRNYSSMSWSSFCGGHGHRRRSKRFEESSGNWAFDEYRADTLKRLEDEFEEFQGFLEQLRRAKDKEEFDNFMATRKNNRDQDPQADAPTT